MPPRSEFAAKVLAVVRRIPYGRVATYGDVAAMAGHPRAHRSVGAIMRDCHDPSVPCHRVIAAGGSLGGYGHNLQLKRERLRAEGLEVTPGLIRRFAEVRWRPRYSPLSSGSRRTTLSLPARPHYPLKVTAPSERAGRPKPRRRRPKVLG